MLRVKNCLIIASNKVVSSSHDTPPDKTYQRIMFLQHHNHIVVGTPSPDDILLI